MRTAAKLSAVFFTIATIFGISSYESSIVTGTTVLSADNKESSGSEKAYLDIDEYYESQLPKTAKRIRPVSKASGTIAGFVPNKVAEKVDEYGHISGDLLIELADKDAYLSVGKILKDGEEIDVKELKAGERLSFSYAVEVGLDEPDIPTLSSIFGGYIRMTREKDNTEDIDYKYDMKYVGGGGTVIIVQTDDAGDGYYESLLPDTEEADLSLQFSSQTVVGFHTDDKSICNVGYCDDADCMYQVSLVYDDYNKKEIKVIKDGREISASAVNIGDRISYNYNYSNLMIPIGVGNTTMVIVHSDENEYYENIVNSMGDGAEKLNTGSGFIKSISRDAENNLLCSMDNDVLVTIDNNVKLYRYGEEITADKIDIGFSISYNYSEINTNKAKGTTIVIAHENIKPSQYTPTPYPTPTERVVTPKPPKRYKGDYDGDCKITLSDAVMSLKTALGINKIEYDKDFDMDDNGTIDLNDAQITLKIALGIEVE